MGRTRRKRAKKKLYNRPQPLDHELNTINLRKFLTRNGFNDEINLKLRNFPETGRGISTSSVLHENDILITIPYKLMVTFTTLQKSNFLNYFVPNSKLTIHDLLTAFLVFERHKKNSFWMDYINSLPPKPPWLPLLMSEEHIELLPADLRLAVKKSRRLLDGSWLRVRKSMKNSSTCNCCGEKTSCVLDLHSFTWGYILVNTRAVYVNPQTVKELTKRTDILSDEPCMALCPFLDMFNHSYRAETKADLIDFQGNLVYQLTTLTYYKKNEQVFISYGAHDNIKLFTEYGFFISENPHDSFKITIDEIFKIFAFNLSDFRYKFIYSHDLNKDLAISKTGPTFNLKALLFVACYNESEVKKNLASIIYSENYSEFFLEKCETMCKQLLFFILKRQSEILQNMEGLTGLNSLVIDFLECTLDSINKLYDNKQ